MAFKKVASSGSECRTAGTLFGVSHKTTVYLPDDMKLALERKAQRRGCSEAQVVREALATAVGRPRPKGGLFESGESLSSRVDELLVGFGER
jgi:Ribbon-helix-helix protein, copG family